MTRRALVAVALAALLLAGCGFGPGDEQEGGGASLLLTRDFGHETLGTAEVDSVRDSDTVMSFLRSDFDIETRYGGGFVQSIEGIEGGGVDAQLDWFFWVNGVQSAVGAADYELHPGDRAQFDYRDWRATMSVPAIVGAYPEPFERGWEGERRPVRLECEHERARACELARRRLDDAGVAVSGALLGGPGGESVARILVGRWAALRALPRLTMLEGEPDESGVFARFAPDGRSLELLDGAGEPARTVRPGDGAGLVAAVMVGDDELAWVVTGLDDVGVERAAAALEEEPLRGAFAVAATGRGTPERLPLVER